MLSIPKIAVGFSLTEIEPYLNNFASYLGGSFYGELPELLGRPSMELILYRCWRLDKKGNLGVLTRGSSSMFLKLIDGRKMVVKPLKLVSS